MTYVLDTDTFSDATFGARGLRERIDREREAHQVVVSVITRNIKHFRLILGLKLENWSA